MTMSSWPYSTASPGSTRLAPTTPSAGATTSCGDAEHVDRRRAGRRPGPRVPGSRLRRGWKIPTAGEVATTRRLSGAGIGHPDRRDSSRPGPTGVRPVPTRRDAHGRPALRARSLGASRSRRRCAIGRAAQPDPPAALADLELAEAGRRELGDQRRQQLGRAGGRSRRGRPPARRRLRSARRSVGRTGSGTR